jgi:hypothetical protein
MLRLAGYTRLGPAASFECSRLRLGEVKEDVSDMSHTGTASVKIVGDEKPAKFLEGRAAAQMGKIGASGSVADGASHIVEMRKELEVPVAFEFGIMSAETACDMIMVGIDEDRFWLVPETLPDQFQTPWCQGVAGLQQNHEVGYRATHHALTFDDLEPVI